MNKERFGEDIINEASTIAQSWGHILEPNERGFLVLGIAIELAMEVWLDLAQTPSLAGKQDANYNITVKEIKHRQIQTIHALYERTVHAKAKAN